MLLLPPQEFPPVDPKLLSDTIITASVILGGLALGYYLRKAGRLPESAANPINRFALIAVQPLVIALALWMMKPVDWQALLLPLYGIVLILAMWPVSALVGRWVGLDRPSLGTFVSGSMFSNVGFTFGTFIAYMAMGPQGAALGSLYCVSFMPSFFTLGFYAGRFYSPTAEGNMWQALRQQFLDPATRNPVLGIALGLALNAFRIAPPPHSDAIISIAMPATTFSYLLAIGLGLHLSAVKEYWRECLLLHVSKFVISPALGLLLAIPFGYWVMADRSNLAVIFIEASAPVAIMSVMLAEMCTLNPKLAGALWITTNVTAVFLAPVVLIVARMLMHA
jgi:predicted permease